MQRHKLFLGHTFILSICSTIGQLFIFSTIEEFSLILFIILLTLRQGFSIFLSCIFYNHQLTWLSILGVHITFLSVFIHAFIQFKKYKQSNNIIV